MKEQELQKEIIKYLKLKRYVVVKFSSVGIFDQKSQTYIPQRQKGISDILALSPDGMFYAIECKLKYNKPTVEQLEFIESVNKNKGIGFIAYDLDAVIEKCK